MMRSGYSLVELLFALILGGLISTAAFKLLQTQSSVAGITAERARRAEAMRTAAQVLTAETRMLLPDRDLHGFAPDSIALRAFRGSGIVCSANGSRARVRYRGSRAPDPSKDSLVVLRDTMFETVTELLGAGLSTGCTASPGEQVFLLETRVLMEAGDAVALFESGSYYLADGALRYRLGREGRQPVTSELFENPRMRFEGSAGAELHALLTLRPSRSTARAALRVRLPFAPRTP